MTNEIETIPNPKNFCGGNFQDWLEVYLTGTCNGKCSFCIDKFGFKPDNRIDPRDLVKTIIDSGQKNILLLGGEPTLYQGFGYVTEALKKAGRKVTVTTNGSMLNNKDILKDLQNVSCVNISIHHHNLETNAQITGILLNKDLFRGALNSLRDCGVEVRFNCNIIKGYIDAEWKIAEYLWMAYYNGVGHVRFAELKNDDRFVSLAQILQGRYGLNENPFILGCWQNADICGMHVNFRQLCGMQTNKRPAPINPKQILKKVLYYDGKLYDGWQSLKENDMSKKDVYPKDVDSDVIRAVLKISLVAVLKQVKIGALDPNNGAQCIMDLIAQLYDNALAPAAQAQTNPVPITRSAEPVTTTGSGCVY